MKNVMKKIGGFCVDHASEIALGTTLMTSVLTGLAEKKAIQETEEKITKKVLENLNKESA